MVRKGISYYFELASSGQVDISSVPDLEQLQSDDTLVALDANDLNTFRHEPVDKLVVFYDDHSVAAAVKIAKDVRAVLRADGEVSKIVAALGLVLAGQRYLCPDLFAERCAVCRSGPFPSDQKLTGRERQIAALLQQGKTYKQIAMALKISPITVKVHVHNLFRKLSINRRAQLAQLPCVA